MAKYKIHASAVIIVTILLTVVLFVAASINMCSASVVNQSIASLETIAVDDVTSVTVVINELMADNDAAVQSPDGTYPDWIELYNNGDYSIDLSGMYLTDNLANPTWQFPSGTVIGANSYLLVWADGNVAQGPLHADFRLNANGETVGLLASDGETLIDSVTYDKQIRDLSYGRTSDGSSSWSYMTNPTPGESNVRNSQANGATPWPIWLFIILALAACIAVVLKNRIRTRRKE
ncbi:MAG: lamin tail domain-containing protein [Promethearchaeota archaeon]